MCVHARARTFPGQKALQVYDHGPETEIRDTYD